ncbi:peptide chain release factor 1 [uncultured Granulicatella sp.]|uniref:peptide chain release factor 1 n=1 Tax=uncultured Granulicatella sp. TaxID=316089 RepID=UPI0028D5375B|nr:peptide chain release factor 1 [uncultured Granulicatella sp.]
MFDQLDSFIIRYDELSELLSDPDVISDTKRFMELTKEESNLRPKVETFKRYQQVVEEISDTEEMLGEGLDSEMVEMAKEELASLKKEKVELEEKIKFLLLPEDPNDGKNIIMEIRGAAGGDEAALFAGDLLSMYQKYAESQGWRVEVMDANITGIGGYKEVILMITGDNVFSKLKYESGAHRVQRVPSTESQGRVHTSTATVVVMPEAEEVEIELEDKDIRVDIYHASGAGGQHVNKTASAVRLTHLPTGIVVAMQDERSQLKNREKAMKVLRARVYDKISQEAQSEYDANRKSAVGTGDRSERIRTYNFPQNRVTDHRIGLTLQKLDQVLAGKIDEIVDALILYDHTEKLEQLNNGNN